MKMTLALALAASLGLAAGPAQAGSGGGHPQSVFPTHHDPWRHWGRPHHGHGHHGFKAHHFVGPGYRHFHNGPVIVVPGRHGHVVVPAPPRRVFVPGYWAWWHHGWTWVPGHWTP
jgi:hypothetical protein